MSPPSPQDVPSLAESGLAPALAQRAADVGWHTPTPIQQASLAPILQGRDVLALAPTGSGKTAAFALPLLQRLLGAPAWPTERPRRLRALILAPTRELAAQTRQVLRALAPQLTTMLAVGGVSINPQMMALRGGAHLVVATPGRLLDLVGQNALRLSAIEIVVFDEADRLLDLGFADEIGQVLALLPRARQTLMFSATMPDALATLAATAMRDALRIDATAHGAAAAPPVRQRAIEVDSARRTALLRQLMRDEGWERALVFVATQYATEHVADKLRRSGVAAAALHGRLSQGRRSQVLADFHQRKLALLVTTDLAARGLDVVDLAVVVNHDLPRAAVDYTHRIGRTARAGAQGQAISFICADAPGSEAHFRLIEKRRQQRVPREQVPGYEPVGAGAGAAAGDATGGVKGRRKSKKDKLREAAAVARHCTRRQAA